MTMNGAVPSGAALFVGRTACPRFAGFVLYSAHASSLRLRSARAHFVRRPVGLASALTRFGWEFITTVIPVETGIQCRYVRCTLSGMDSRFRANNDGKSGRSDAKGDFQTARTRRFDAPLVPVIQILPVSTGNTRIAELQGETARENHPHFNLPGRPAHDGRFIQLVDPVVFSF